MPSRPHAFPGDILSISLLTYSSVMFGRRNAIPSGMRLGKIGKSTRGTCSSNFAATDVKYLLNAVAMSLHVVKVVFSATILVGKEDVVGKRITNVHVGVSPCTRSWPRVC